MPAPFQIRTILAPNPSPMTFTGTNTYLVGKQDVAVIDPGPDDPSHLSAILSALEPGEKITHILVTHAHVDHSRLVPELKKATGAKSYAFGTAETGRSQRMQDLIAAGYEDGGEGADLTFAPDVLLKDGDRISGQSWSLEAIHTPGHMGCHVMFAEKGHAFSGDHVMGWATSMVSPPDGDLTDFMASLEKLLPMNWEKFYPGHGEAIDDPNARLRELYAHRKDREAQILAQLKQVGRSDINALTRAIYTDVDPRLIPIAARNVLAHLIDLEQRNLAQRIGALGKNSLFQVV